MRIYQWLRRTSQEYLSRLFWVQTFIGLLDFEGDFGLGLIFLDVSRAVDGSREEYMNANGVQQELRPKSLGKAWQMID